MAKGLFLSFILVYIASSARAQDCSSLPQAVIDDIQSYQAVVNQIIDYFINGAYKGVTYQRLAYLTDTFGPRLAGSSVLENAIDYLVQESINAGFSNVYTEDVNIPYWVRNDESLELTSPRQETLPYMSFGSSVATPAGGIEAEVLVVSSFDDLAQNAPSVSGKIVVYDVPFTTYDDTKVYRSDGADAASQYGAVAALVRSVTDFSIDSPHTGTMLYNGSVPMIPTGAVTVEDATMMHRMQDRGDVVRVRLVMDAETLPDTTSRNMIADISGSVSPSEVVGVSGHLDSWDAGEGVMDDAGGCIISWLAATAFMDLGLTPRRTFRVVFFTAEEVSLNGGLTHFLSYNGELNNIQIMFESDGGLFEPYGIGFNGTDEATCMMQEILNLMSSLNTTLLTDDASVPDLFFFQGAGVPTASPEINRERYFWFHHSEGDSMEVVDTDELDRCAALWAAVSYVTADMAYRLPTDITAL